MKDDTREENEKRRERKRTTDSGGWYTHPRKRDPSRYGNKRVPYALLCTNLPEIDQNDSFGPFVRYPTNFFRTFSRETRVIDRGTTSLTSPTTSRSRDEIFLSPFSLFNTANLGNFFRGHRHLHRLQMLLDKRVIFHLIRSISHKQWLYSRSIFHLYFSLIHFYYII